MGISVGLLNFLQMFLPLPSGNKVLLVIQAYLPALQWIFPKLEARRKLRHSNIG